MKQWQKSSIFYGAWFFENVKNGEIPQLRVGFCNDKEFK